MMNARIAALLLCLCFLGARAFAQEAPPRRGMPLISAEEEALWADGAKENAPILLTVEVKGKGGRELLTIEDQAAILDYLGAFLSVRVDMSASVWVKNIETPSTTYTFMMSDGSGRAYTFYGDLWLNGMDIGYPAIGIEALEALNSQVRQRIIEWRGGA